MPKLEGMDRIDHFVQIRVPSFGPTFQSTLCEDRHQSSISAHSVSKYHYIQGNNTQHICITTRTSNNLDVMDVGISSLRNI